MKSINHSENINEKKIEAIVSYILKNNNIPTQKSLIELAKILDNKKNEKGLIQQLNDFENILIQY